MSFVSAPGYFRFLRGGGWSFVLHAALVDRHNSDAQNSRGSYLGLRLVRRC